MPPTSSPCQFIPHPTAHHYKHRRLRKSYEMSCWLITVCAHVCLCTTVCIVWIASLCKPALQYIHMYAGTYVGMYLCMPVLAQTHGSISPGARTQNILAATISIKSQLSKPRFSSFIVIAYRSSCCISAMASGYIATWSEQARFTDQTTQLTI